MDLVKLLDVSSPKHIKEIINTLITDVNSLPDSFPTKESLGLNRVDNTNDLEKPISNATQEALNRKFPSADANKSFISNVGLAYDATKDSYTLTYTHKNLLTNSTTTVSGAPIGHASEARSGLLTPAKLAEIENNTEAIKNLPNKLSAFENDTGFITEKSLENISGKIDTIKVNGVPQDIIDKEVNINVPSIEGLASETFVNTKTTEILTDAKKHTDETVANLINQAPETLDTFKEIADALAEDQVALDTLNAAIGNKVNKTLKINGKPLEQDINLTAADVGALSSFTETDPTVPAWAKAATKPSYNYSEINNTPAIPIVNNPTVTVKQGGETKGSFTLNQSGDATIELDAGGKSDSSTKILEAKQISSGSTSASYRITDTITVEEGTEIVVRFDKNPTYVVPIYLEINGATYLIYQQSYLQGVGYRSNYVQFSNDDWKAGDLIRLQYATELISYSSTVQGFVAVENITNSYYYGTSTRVVIDNSLNAYSDKPVTNQVITTELNKKPNFVETEEVNITVNRLLDLVFPVGSLRLSNNANEQNFMGGTWEITAEGRTIIGAGILGDNQYNVGDLIPAGLPNITGEQKFSTNRGFPSSAPENTTGALGITAVTGGYFDNPSDSGTARTNGITFDASKSNPIYGNSNTVHMNGFVTYIYVRVA